MSVTMPEIDLAQFDLDVREVPDASIPDPAEMCSDGSKYPCWTSLSPSSRSALSMCQICC